MSNISRKVMLVKTSAADNNNKFYEVTLYSNGDVVGRNGRVGTDGVLQHKGIIGESGFDKLVKSKLSGGYKQVDLATKNESAPARSGCIATIAKNEIAKSANPTLLALIDQLAQINRFQLLAATDGQIDIIDGEVRTPVGLVSLASINAARDKLNNIAQFVQTNDFGSQYVQCLEDYLHYVPQKIPLARGWADTFFTKFTSVQNQNSLLDQLEGSVKQAVIDANDKVEDDKPVQRIFGYSLDLVEDDSIINRIKRFYEGGLHSMHVSSNRKLVRVYALENADKASKYETLKSKLGNEKMLWHGTQAHNVLSIMKGGLIIPPTNGNYTISGRMFGDGVYFSDQASKSLNYSVGYWGNGGLAKGNVFMFNASVTMGREHTPRGPISRIPDGFDSIFAKGGQSGVMNNEMIVNNVDQFKLDFLCEFQ